MMNVAEIAGARQPLRLTTRPIPSPPDDGFLLKTVYSGICHSDLHAIHDTTDLGGGKMLTRSKILGDKYKGLVLGHEIAGVIEQFGSKVDQSVIDLKVGDKVIIHPFCGCGECGLCKAGSCNVCEFNTGGVTDIGVGVDGGFATHVSIAKCSYAVKVPDSIPLEIACTLSCSAITAYEAILRAKDVIDLSAKAYGEVSILVVGAGGLGLWGIQLAKLIFPEVKVKVTCADIDVQKLELATSVGADDTILLDPAVAKDDQMAVVNANGSRFFEVVLDFVCHPKSTEVAMGALRKCGAYMMVGLFGGAITLSLPLQVWRAVTIRGTRAARPETLRTLVKNAATWNLKYPDPEFYTLDRVNEALQKLEQGKINGRAILRFD